MENSLNHIDTNDLRLELERRGYYTRNLWTTYDVTEHPECLNDNEEVIKTFSHDECIEILHKALTNEWVVDQINYAINQQISE